MQTKRPTRPNLECAAQASGSDLHVARNIVRIMIAAFVNWEDVFLQNRMGAIDPAGRAADEAAMRGILSAPSYRAAWKTLRYQFGGDCRDHVDAMVRQAEPTPAIDLGAACKANLAEELASRLAGRLGDFERRRTTGLLLDHRGARPQRAAWRYVAHFQLH